MIEQQQVPMENGLIKDLWRIINNDEYAWICCWGPPRTGKSTLCLYLSYCIYKDWEDVLNSITFNLNGVLHKLTEGKPRMFPTFKGLNNRVPLLFVDDFGANCNKAITQYNRAWDLFKGSFDTLGTVVGILLANMVKPNEATQQLTEKYTHEIWVHSRGQAKYDIIHQQQDFKFWNCRQKKTYMEEIEFPEVPDWVYKEYNTMRVSLAKEALYNIQEVISTNEVPEIIKRIGVDDRKILYEIWDGGPMKNTKLKKAVGYEESSEAIMHLKAKGLIVSNRVGNHYYKYELTDLGSDTVKELKHIKD